MPNAKREIGHDRETGAGRSSEMTEAAIHRRYPIGAELIGEGLTHFRVWAPKAEHLDVILESSPENEAERTFHPLAAESGGYFAGAIAAEAIGEVTLRSPPPCPPQPGRVNTTPVSFGCG